MRLKAWNDRWRAFADATALALGMNLWVSLVLLPFLAVGAGNRDAAALTMTISPVFLVLGVWKRNEVLLLFGFPSSLLLPIAIVPEMASAQLYGPARFTIVALGLVVFLFAASTLTSFYDPPKPERVRALQSAAAGVAPRWRRRFRLYAFLSLLAVAFPLSLLYHINFDQAGTQALAENYPGRAATFATMLNVFAIGLWLMLFGRFLLAPLKQHRTGDRELSNDVAILRGRASATSPRLVFYLGGITAVALMALWVLWKP